MLYILSTRVVLILALYEQDVYAYNYTIAASYEAKEWPTLHALYIGDIPLLLYPSKLLIVEFHMS